MRRITTPVILLTIMLSPWGAPLAQYDLELAAIYGDVDEDD